jgi:thiosulfate reductase cytochrome b subunit
MGKLYVNPLPVRIWHWINAFGFVALILTGLQLRFSGQVNVLSFQTAVQVHNWIGFVLIANFFLWLGYHLFSDKIKVYHTELDSKKFFEDTFRQMRFYGWGIFFGEKNPHHITPLHKFNPLQSMMYQIVMMILVPLQFGTGLLLWDVTRFWPVVEALGGVRMVDTLHVLLSVFFSAFIFMHVYMSSLGHTPSAHFKAMVTGYEDEDHDEKKPVTP